ncbi:MAG: MFS transporter [Thiotrichales bacterium]|jgi:predicted MFS family arabinose efflux permease|nr:MFS transporter [Thiotrichales bacterium]MBT6771544.1 MFS transporter [Thiotrichales bacterium]MBT7150363.1 MFS transporter [Thiotrichales bacterium]MBT7438698.1 MFS transporter [Thiotrichales bacterium]MBT7934548.1 MFS transporter [Thiotrichales bacterium]
MKIARKSPELLILLMTIGSGISWAVWLNLLNNFAIEEISFTGAEMGILQSLREVPGFLAFTVIFVLAFVKEQKLAYLSLAMLGVGVLITGLVEANMTFYLATIIMSIGFHYFETINGSLTLQWVDKDKTAEFLGRVIATRSAASIIAFSFIWILFQQFQMSYLFLYAIGGGVSVVLVLFCWQHFPLFPEKVTQTKKIILRKRYWLYYALQFMSGARRQIFVVFAGFLMVEKFNFTVAEISLLLIANAAINVVFAPKIGRLIQRFGERKSLIFEYVGLSLIFAGYAFVESSAFAVFLYIADHLLFSIAIALKTYFQKIADPADIASSAGVSFTINHIAAVFIPVVFGLVWLYSPSLVFLAGSGMAIISLLLAFNMPANPASGNEVLLGKFS